LSSAQAHFGESLTVFGDELAHWTAGKVNSKQGRLALNGVAIHRVTIGTPLSVKDALDRLQQVCMGRGGLENPEALLKPDLGLRKSTSAHVWDGTFRHDARNQGVLACIDTERPLTVVELVRRLQDFGRTGNLASVGALRYVLARREADVTSLLVLWTAGDAPLLRMFPESGDAPGREVPDMPRPVGSRRLLSAVDQTSPYAITVYRSEGSSPISVRTWYERELQSQGWRVSRTKEENALVVRRAGRTILIRSASTTSGGATTSIVELS
jgi:hypothetical protein